MNTKGKICFILKQENFAGQVIPKRPTTERADLRDLPSTNLSPVFTQQTVTQGITQYMLISCIYQHTFLLRIYLLCTQILEGFIQ
jgi:hypothetical protein